MDARVSKGIFLVLWAVPPLRLRARSAKETKKGSEHDARSRGVSRDHYLEVFPRSAISSDRPS